MPSQKPETCVSPRRCREIYLCWGMCSTLYQSLEVLLYSFHSASAEPQGPWRGEVRPWGLLRSFSCMCTAQGNAQCCMGTWPSGFPRTCCFSKLLWMSPSSAFLLKLLWMMYCLLPNVISSGSYGVNWLASTDKCSVEKVCSHEVTLRLGQKWVNLVSPVFLGSINQLK